jgi:3-deoxy-D-manno-octulosonate 8-phosphate phosphatase (KDO 8-P phosphatase)
VRYLLLDVDGVLTDGTIYLDSAGREIKAFHILDGSGIRLALDAGLGVGLLSGRRSPVVRIRARELGIRDVHQGAVDKAAVYDRLRRRHDLRDAEVAYMGDDVIDLPVLARVGLAVTVPNAHDQVRAAAHFTTDRRGGQGAVRELIDLLLTARGLPLVPRPRGPVRPAVARAR